MPVTVYRPRAALLVAHGLALIFAVVMPVTAAAQRVPAFGGVELRAGMTFPEHASVAPVITGEADIGYLWRPALRIIAGLSHFRANIDREPGDDEGSFRAIGVWLGGRYDLMPLASTSPYVRASVTIHSVDADAWDSDVGALLTGTNAGAAIAVGARRVLDTRGRLSGTVELRRTAMNNIANTAFEIGLRLQNRGALAYAPVTVAVAPQPLYDPRDPRTPPRTPALPRQPTTPVDTAAARRLAEAWMEPDPAVAEAEAQRVAQLAERQAREAAIAEQRTAAIAAERAAAGEALLRQGLNRAAVTMRSGSSTRETDAAFIVTLGGTAFATGAGSLAPAARSELRVLATVLAGYPGHIVSVEGHTDAVGDPAANQALSVERAAAVRAALIVEGVDPLWTDARGFGATRPVASNDTAAGRAANRRVEIHIRRVPCAEPPRPGPDGTLDCPPVAR
jgi:outer membrane protein OmpA-like peptidoglycan-associated protein